MEIEWNIVATIAAPTIALFIGALLNHFLENRPRLISYLAHASAFRSSQKEGEPINVHTHAIVLRNAGRKAAKNVRLSHAYLPDFQIYPDIEYKIVDLPAGGKEIQFPTLIPKKQITVTYLYFPPLTWDKINTHTESDEGPAKVITILPVPQYPKWVYLIIWFLILYGVVGIVYSIVALLK